MLFNSLEYLVFLPVVVALYFAIRPRYRWILLLAASYYFYMCWKAEYVVLIVGSTLIDYFAAHRMARMPTRRAKKKYLILSLVANLGLLFAFKYFNFFNDSIREVLHRFNVVYDVPGFHFLLPVGISFYTFQTLSYTIDVYRGKKEPEKHLGLFALYVSFFPQLVAGPIERSTRLLPQLARTQTFDFERMQQGLQLILWGFFKKVVIADRLAVYVNAVYNSPENHEGAPLIVATYFFAFQIYCDFSGYSDIAIGSAMILGYDLMENFTRPYFSRSVAEFWKRWHISLSEWFRDYLYLSIGGNRVVRWRWFANLFVVFLLSGFWHGANWTFLVWGALHGTYLVASILTTSLRDRIGTLLRAAKWPRLTAAFQIVMTFHLVILGWVFFRANSLSDALTILSRMTPWKGWAPGRLMVGLRETEFIIAVGSVAILVILDFMQRRTTTKLVLPDRPVWYRWLAFYSLIFGILIFGRFTSEEFIYFQF